MAKFRPNFFGIFPKCSIIFFLKIAGKRSKQVLKFGEVRKFDKNEVLKFGEVRNFKKVRKFASSNLKFRSSRFKFTEILICNPGGAPGPPALARQKSEFEEDPAGVGEVGAVAHLDEDPDARALEGAAGLVGDPRVRHLLVREGDLDAIVGEHPGGAQADLGHPPALAGLETAQGVPYTMHMVRVRIANP